MGKGGDKVGAKVDLTLMNLSQRDLIFFLLLVCFYTSDCGSCCWAKALQLYCLRGARNCYRQLATTACVYCQGSFGVWGTFSFQGGGFKDPSEVRMWAAVAGREAWPYYSAQRWQTLQKDLLLPRATFCRTAQLLLQFMQNHGLKEHIWQRIIWGLDT